MTTNFSLSAIIPPGLYVLYNTANKSSNCSQQTRECKNTHGLRKKEQRRNKEKPQITRFTKRKATFRRPCVFLHSRAF